MHPCVGVIQYCLQESIYDLNIWCYLSDKMFWYAFVIIFSIDSWVSFSIFAVLQNVTPTSSNIRDRSCPPLCQLSLPRKPSNAPGPLMEVGNNPRINTSRPRQNGRRFADNICKSIFLNENCYNFTNIPLKCVPLCSILTINQHWFKSNDGLVYWRVFVSPGNVRSALCCCLKTVDFTHILWVSSLARGHSYEWWKSK